MSNSIAKNVVSLKNARGWTQERLARESGLTPSTISRIVNGGGSVSSASINALANAFGVTPAALFSDDDLPAPAPEKVRRCPWQKRIETMQTTINYEIRNILFGDCLEDACPYWFDMNGEKICRKVEWPDD